MSRIRHRLYGVSLCISGAPPETILNALAGAGIRFADPVREEGRLTIRVAARRVRLIRGLCLREGYEMQVLGRGAVTAAARRLRRRLILLVGVLPLLAALWLSSLFIWQIDVEGNSTVSDGEILRRLEELGVGIGCCRLFIDQYHVSNEMLLQISELSWLSCNTFGSRLVVSVREEVPAPPVTETELATDVTAAKSGIINSMTVLSGAPIVARGDMVEQGQLLVASATPDLSGELRSEHAMAVVEAWTYYELSACTPLEALSKEYSGTVNTRRALFLFAKRINLYILSGNQPAFCDRITVYESLMLPGGTVLPFGLMRQSFCPYEPVPAPLDEQAARMWLEGRLRERLEGMIDGRIMSETYLASSEDGVLTVTLRAVCLENIAVTVPASAGQQ